MTISPESPEKDMQAALEQFYADVAGQDLQPLWTQVKDLMPRYPKPAALPWLWRWETLSRLAQEAGYLITVERGGERRVLALANPGLNGEPYATPTLWAAIQYLNAHESAPAHRHSPGAIRFVLEGEGTWTTVNGDACDMHRGDLVLTPGWNWHDHNNASNQPMVWFDGLDLPTIRSLDAVFFEPYPDLTQQAAPLHNISEHLYAGRGMLPLGAKSDGKHSPLMVYRWSAIDASLDNLLKATGDKWASLQFVDPTTGKAVMPTLGCEMHRVVAGGHTLPYRKVGSSVFVVFQGSGYSVINGQRFDWHPGDIFVTPSWAVYEHVTHTQADLFAITDRPLLETLGLFRGETGQAFQEITSQFQAK